MKQELNETILRLRSLMHIHENMDVHEIANTHIVSTSKAILSHLSDIQIHVSEEQRKHINFVKALVWKLKDGVHGMTEEDMDELYNQWVLKK